MNFFREKSIPALVALITMAICACVAGCTNPGAPRPANLSSPNPSPNPKNVVAAQTLENTAPDSAIDLRRTDAPAKSTVFEMIVESEPAGAMVVIDGTPSGKAPCRVLLDGSVSGFYLNAFSIKARFIATDGNGHSQTIEETFSKHDKIPAKLRFTTEGATRVLRED